MIPATAPSLRPATSARVLPREHGAYGLLLFPLASALLQGPTVAAATLAVAYIAGFLAHSPLLVLLGTSPVLPDGRARAARWGMVLAAVAIAGAGLGLALARPPARVAALVSAVPVLAALGLRAVGRHRSAPFQLLAALALPACSIPVALAAGAAPGDAAVPGIVWSAGFFVACAAVRAVKGRTSWRSEVATALGAGALGLAAVGTLVAAGVARPRALVALAPLLALALALFVRPGGARSLRTVGWSIVGASAATLALLARAAT